MSKKSAITFESLFPFSYDEIEKVGLWTNSGIDLLFFHSRIGDLIEVIDRETKIVIERSSKKQIDRASKNPAFHDENGGNLEPAIVELQLALAAQGLLKLANKKQDESGDHAFSCVLRAAELWFANTERSVGGYLDSDSRSKSNKNLEKGLPAREKITESEKAKTVELAAWLKHQNPRLKFKEIARKIIETGTVKRKLRTVEGWVSDALTEAT